MITSPAYVVIKAANELKDKTTAVNQMWLTNFNYFKITGWGRNYLSTLLADFSRYIVARKLCTNMCASDVMAMLEFYEEPFHLTPELHTQGIISKTVSREKSPRLCSLKNAP